MFNNFEISLMVFMPNITTNHAITHTNLIKKKKRFKKGLGKVIRLKGGSF